MMQEHNFTHTELCGLKQSGGSDWSTDQLWSYTLLASLMVRKALHMGLKGQYHVIEPIVL